MEAACVEPRIYLMRAISLWRLLHRTSNIPDEGNIVMEAACVEPLVQEDVADVMGHVGIQLK